MPEPTGTTLGDVSLPPPQPNPLGGIDQQSAATATLPPPVAGTAVTTGRSAGAVARSKQRTGTLATGWRVVFGLGWGGVILCLGAVWNSSRTMGLALWRLGAEAQPRSFAIQLLPFALPVLMVIAAMRNWRFLPYLGIVAALAGAAIAWGDLSPFRRYGLIELAIADAALALSLASIAGMYRGARRSEPAN